MAITVSDVINIHPFVPNPNVQSPYPVGIWKAQRTQVTDASGGVVRWTAAPASLENAYKYLWSLEDYSWITSVMPATDLYAYIEVFTGEVVSRAGGSETLRFASTNGTPQVGLVGRLSAWYNKSKQPVFPFIHQPGGGNLNTYIMEIQNINAQVLTMTFWGYFWNSYARRLASGPIRP